MKRCPACSRIYDDEQLRFCLDDGTVLVDKRDIETAVLYEKTNEITPEPTIKDNFGPVPQRPQEPEFQIPAKKRRLWPWALGIVVVLFGFASTVAGFYIMRSRTRLPWHLILEVNTTSNREVAVQQTIDIIKRRLDAYGISRFRVEPDSDPKTGRILVDLPILKNPERAKQIITSGGLLELAHVISSPSPNLQTYNSREEAISSLNSKGLIPQDRRVLPYEERDSTPEKWVVIESPAIVDARELRDAIAYPEKSGDYSIQFSLNPNGADKFGRWTGDNVNEYMGVVLNGKVKSIAFIESQISDSGRINGHFTQESADDLALTLKAGVLPAPLILTVETIDK